ncbi:MAG: NAD+ synthase [Bacteroidetes bacterium]|nr:NAD+ synthase [Bacteroidota bacterium]
MRIAIAQNNYLIGDFEQNVSKIKASIRQAKESRADLILFAELAICGYPSRDFLEFRDYVEKCQQALEDIATECIDIAAIIGAPSFNPDIRGKSLFNAAFFLSDGHITSRHHKSLLPNYDVFDEYRYFEPNRSFETVTFRGKRIAITICEDIWNIGNDLLYVLNPMDELMKQNPDVLVNIAASPFHYDQARLRRQILVENARRYQIPVFYVNQVGAHTEMIFDGGSMIISPGGEVFHEMAYFREDFDISELNNVIRSQSAAMPQKRHEKIELIHEALVLGIRDYFQKLRFNKAILGLSGGIDSALTLVLAAEAIGPENVLSVLMPSEFSSQHSVEDSLLLLKNLGSPHYQIGIQEAFRVFKHTLSPVFQELPPDITEENIQARIRAVILMALSNKFGHILLNTSNKSEASVGYGTLYGDMCGGLSVLGDVYKTQVYELSRLINAEKEIIPNNILIKPPSAELRPNQKDSDSLPEYSILDQILFEYIEQRRGPKDLIALGFEEEMVKKVLRLVNMNEYKRYQTPPILRISPKAFGMGRRMPIVARYLS